MTSYPKTVWKFVPWSKAMVAGATVGTPEYKASGPGIKKSSTRARKHRKKRRRRKTNNAKKNS